MPYYGWCLFCVSGYGGPFCTAYYCSAGRERPALELGLCGDHQRGQVAPERGPGLRQRGQGQRHAGNNEGFGDQHVGYGTYLPIRVGGHVGWNHPVLLWI